jgi:integrase
MKVRSLGKYGYKRDVLTQDEVRKAIEEAENLALKALIAFLYLYGTRISEALGMEKKDFDVFARSVRARITLLKKRQSGSPLIAMHRVSVGTNAPFIAYLVEYLNLVQEGKLWRFSRMTAWRKIHRLLSVSPHFFRHTRATRLAEKTDNPFVLVDWFGWANANPATKYIQMSGRLAARLSDKVD